MSTKTTTSERLRDSIQESAFQGNFDQKVEALHDYVREQGVRGHHSTRFTLRRWIDGRGNPPPYWVEAACGFLEVNPIWLLTGEGTREMNRGPQRDVITSRNRALKPSQPGKAGMPAPKPVEVEPTPKTVKPVKEVKVSESEVSVPSKEDVYVTNGPTIINFIERTTSIKAVLAIREHEVGHPKYEGGRRGVLAAADLRLAQLREIPVV